MRYHLVNKNILSYMLAILALGVSLFFYLQRNGSTTERGHSTSSSVALDPPNARSMKGGPRVPGPSQQETPLSIWSNQANELSKPDRFKLIEQICRSEGAASLIEFIKTLQVGDEQSFAIRESLNNCVFEDLDGLFRALLSEYEELYPEIFKEPNVPGVHTGELANTLSLVKTPTLRLSVLRSAARATEFVVPSAMQEYLSTQTKILSKSEQEYLRGQLFNANFHLDPESYFKHACSFEFDSRYTGSAPVQAFIKWMDTSPEVAIDYLLDSTPQDMREEIFPKAIARWLQKYPVEASNKLNLMDRGTLRDTGISELITYLLIKKDLSSARQWAESITDPSRKLSALALLNSHDK